MTTEEQAKVLESLRYERELALHGPSVVTRLDGATLITKPDERSEYPSANGNHVHGLGVFETVTEAHIDDVIGHYRERSIPRFFVYVSPCAQYDQIERWLLERGLWERLPQDVLYRSPLGSVVAPPLLQVDGPNSGIDPYHWAITEFASVQGMFVYSTLMEEPDYQHYAYGVLYANGPAAYLGPAGTHEAHRKRGAQTALIAARLAKARELGCEHVFAETYRKILKTSYNNLLRAGFEHTYSCPIYVWEED